MTMYFPAFSTFPSLPNGQILQRHNNTCNGTHCAFKSIFYFNCNSGYERNGNWASACNGTESWLYPIPTCRPGNEIK